MVNPDEVVSRLYAALKHVFAAPHSPALRRNFQLDLKIVHHTDRYHMTHGRPFELIDVASGVVLGTYSRHEDCLEEYNRRVKG